MKTETPMIIEVHRGGLLESRHRGIAAVIDSHGKILHAWGDIDRHIYPRSAIKPILALPLIESGAAEAFELGDPEIALACASHSGEPTHVRAVSAWLARIGLGAADLGCGSHWSHDQETAHDWVRSGQPVTAINNNCSGKHTGFLATAKHLGEPTAGYIKPEHPVQIRLAAILAEMGDTDLSQTARGIDGCGIPVLGMPLSAMALAMARMAEPSGLGPVREAAAKRIVSSMTAHPYNVAGRNRFDTLAMQAGNGRFAVKAGAEAVHAAIIPELGVGVVLKIDDGTKRASEVAMANILAFLGVLDPSQPSPMSNFFEAPIVNTLNDIVGVVRMADGWADG